MLIAWDGTYSTAHKYKIWKNGGKWGSFSKMQLFTVISGLFEILKFPFNGLKKKERFLISSVFLVLFLFSVKSRNLLRYPVSDKKN